MKGHRTVRRLENLETLRAPEGLRGDDVLDAVGLYCPVPILKTAERLRTLTTGQTLEVLADDRVILLDMPAWCLSTGHAYLGFREDGREWRLFVRKN
ncbi:MAG: sulfurtransferase TusA family protein [Candidatus Polarisedimenticolia bacterium]